ncbi:MAG: sensor histidine kinase, partial [Elusimicrobia bacterium]|nr:sensor histidine kinase [Elusimicrobiota bacterium]
MKAGLLLLLAALCPHASAAPARLDLTTAQGVRPVVVAQVLVDASGSLSIEELRARERAGKFSWDEARRFNFGYSARRRWLKLAVRNRDSAPDWLLEMGYPLIQGVEVHQFDGAKLIASYKTGRLRPFASRPVPYHGFVFPVTVPRGATHELYVMAESNGTLFVPLSFTTRDALLAASVKKTTAFGAYVGIILAMALYNLFLLFAFRDRNYLYYVVYAATFCVLLASLNGMAYQYLWPSWPGWNKVSVPVLVGVSYLFLVLFTRSFLETRRLAPRFDLGLTAVLGGAVFLILGGAFHYGLFVNRFTSLFISAVPLVMIPVSVRCMQRGSYAAIYYLVAFGCFFLGSGTHAARDLGWLPQNFVTDNGPYLGSAAEMLVLSLGLAARIKKLREDKLRSEERLAQEQGAAALASRVAHDIRSPLAALDVVEKDLSRLPESKRVLVRGAINRIRDIANTLVSKKHSADAPISAAPSTESLSGLADAILSEKRLQYRKQAGLVLEADFAAGAHGLFARVEAGALKRDLSNLITNAVEALGPSGRVIVSLHEEDDRAVLAVQDDGMGIPREALPRIGEKGFTHGKPGGQGLGVHHARADALSWGGTLDIESSPGRGTKVALRLPLAQAPAWFVPRLEVGS